MAIICLALPTIALSQQKEYVTLPFLIDFKPPLKLQTNDHLEKYNYTEYVSGEDILQLKQYPNMTRAKATKIIEDRKFFITSIFKDQFAPYPGVLTSTIGCSENLKPKVKEDTASVRIDYRLLATYNFLYGNCNIVDNYYICLYSVFFCPLKQELFELKIFTPIKNPSFDYTKLVESLRCKD